MRLHVLPLFLLVACQALPHAPARPIVRDIHSFAEPNRVRVTHAALELALDFAKKEASGTVTLALVRPDERAPLVVDTKELVIEAVTGASGTPRRWTLGAPDEKLGQALSIELQGGDSSVRIRYRTTERSEAMQWLAPAQTAGGAQPFLFTQGQSILTRSWIPLQDSPGVRITYEARIRCPQGLTPVMSAERQGQDSLGAWRFKLEQPIPPYLIALACGELAFRELSPRCGVWAEPSVVEKAAWELADTEQMVQAAETLFGPYRWGRYDLIVLPPSFPFGGMENPTLTFATPTILAGDRSLVALVAHELAHSWSGNLATNATWSDFWLNEGFTVYCENRIMEVLYGRERAATELVLEIDKLKAELATQEPWQQVLHTDLRGKHPDDGFSEVPYTKGALFLVRLESVVGRARWDKFLRGWFDRHAFQSVTTQDFLDDLARELPEAAQQVDLAQWTEQPGLPADAPSPKTKALAAVDAEVAAYVGGKSPKELASADWTTAQWLRFLRGLPETLSAPQMGALDMAFHFTDSGNSEIVCQWCELAIAHGYGPADERLERFLREVGRRKFIKPLYTALMKADPARAKKLYAENRARYHSVATGTLDGIVK
ncbi:MAG: M1 family peptidase [Planctomycetes bacterium]|nr:M1 family peptidase [Planctomycetota bacterium]